MYSAAYTKAGDTNSTLKEFRKKQQDERMSRLQQLSEKLTVGSMPAPASTMSLRDRIIQTMMGMGTSQHIDTNPSASAPITVEKTMAEMLRDAKVSDDENDGASSDHEKDNEDGPLNLVYVGAIGEDGDKERGLDEQELIFHLSPMSRATEVAPSSIPSPLHHLRVQQLQASSPTFDEAGSYSIDFAHDAFTSRPTVVTNKLLQQAMERRLEKSEDSAKPAETPALQLDNATVVKPSEALMQAQKKKGDGDDSSSVGSSSEGSLSSSSLESDAELLLSDSSDDEEQALQLKSEFPVPVDRASLLSRISLYDSLLEEAKADQSIMESVETMMASPDVPILLFKRRNVHLEPLNFAVDIALFLNERAGSMTLEAYSTRK